MNNLKFKIMGKRLTCNNGDIFGKWTVIDNTPLIKSGHTYIKVRCECGKEELKPLSDLNNGRILACRSCSARARGKNIQIGDKYKHWTVIDGPRLSNWQSIMYLVRCDCGESERWMQPSELTNPNKCFACSKCSSKEAQAKIMDKNGRIGELNINRYSKLKRSAEKRGIEFNVSKEYLWELFVSQDYKCAITGDVLEHLSDASLDRIDSSKGYIEGNVQWVTKQANISKHIMSMEQLYEFCKKVLNHANQQPSQPLTKLEGSETNSWNCNTEYNGDTSTEYPN